MAAEPATTTNGNGRDWKSRAADWLFSQGVSTVLLFAILAVAVYSVRDLVPRHLMQIQEGYQRVGEDLKDVAEKFDKDQDRDQQLLMKLLEKSERINARAEEKQQ